MRLLLGLLILTSCAHQLHSENRPAWVAGVRSGEESLRISHGSKTYYRRIAGSQQFSKTTSCELALIKVEEDIKSEFPLMSSVPFAVEVVYYDEFYQDCAVTVSVNATVGSLYSKLQHTHEKKLAERDELAAKEHLSVSEAAELLRLRSETAIEYALTGLSKDEFENFARDKVLLNEGEGACERVFRAPAYSVHGNTQVCWRGEHVVGYCMSKDGQCWTRTAQ